MAKDDPKTRPKPGDNRSAFQKFENLARKIVRVPKNQAEDKRKS